MAAIRAIPKKLLIHSATIYRVAGEDKWGNETLEEGTELRHVRMEPSSKVARDKNNAEVQLAASLIYDCRNSRPAGMEFMEDDILLFLGQMYRVQTVELLYDDSKPHHYEMGLVRYAKDQHKGDI